MKVTDIPSEVLLEIVINLDKYDLSNLIETNKFFYNLLTDKYFQKRLEGKMKVIETYTRELVSYVLDKNWFMVDALLKQGADPNKVLTIDGDDKKRLLEYKAGNLPDFVNDSMLLWSSPFLAACCVGDQMIMKQMIKYGADINQLTYERVSTSHIGQKNFFGIISTPLVADMILLGKIDAVKFLVDCGVDFTNILRRTERYNINPIVSLIKMSPLLNTNRITNFINDLLELIMEKKIMLDFNERSSDLSDIFKEMDDTTELKPTKTLLDHMSNVRFSCPEELDEVIDRFIHYLQQNGANLGNGQIKKIRIVNFYANWCAYSQRLEPTWKEFKNRMKNSFVEVVDIDCGMMYNHHYNNKYNIKEYPSIILFLDGQQIRYEGNRTVNDLIRFCSQYIN